VATDAARCWRCDRPESPAATEEADLQDQPPSEDWFAGRAIVEDAASCKRLLSIVFEWHIGSPLALAGQRGATGNNDQGSFPG